MDWVALAALRRARGIRGEVVAENLGSEPERFVPGLKATLLPTPDANRGKPVELERAWTHQGSLILKFCGIDDRNEAEALQGWYLCIREEERPLLRKGEVYLSDLVGCEMVAFSDGHRIGVVTGFQDAGGQVLLESGEELLIPYVPEICRQVDTKARRILIDLPEGLEDLNRE